MTLEAYEEKEKKLIRTKELKMIIDRNLNADLSTEEMSCCSTSSDGIKRPSLTPETFSRSFNAMQKIVKAHESLDPVEKIAFHPDDKKEVEKLFNIFSPEESIFGGTISLHENPWLLRKRLLAFRKSGKVILATIPENNNLACFYSMPSMKLTIKTK